MRSIILQDIGWEIDSGICKAPIPDHNVWLDLTTTQETVVKNAIACMNSMTTKGPMFGPDYYIVIQAPLVRGLYRHSTNMTSVSSVITVMKGRVLYVLEWELRGYRMIYDITSHFLNK